MEPIRVSAQLDNRRFVVGRPEARELKPLMQEAAAHDEQITLDTSGIERMGLGFVDELLVILKECRAENENGLRMTIQPPPATPSYRRLSQHRNLMLDADENRWIVTTQ